MINLPVKFNTNNDKPRDKCAVVGVYGHSHAAQMAYYCLHALQHRGQEASGIITAGIDRKSKKHRFYAHKDFGLVSDVFKDDNILKEQLTGNSAIGHNRYSTAGSATNRFNIQPLMVNYRHGNVAISHNGNLTNF